MDRYIKFAVASFPTLIGLFYTSGVIYDSGFFGALGLDSDMFIRGLNETVVRGVLALLVVSSSNIWNFVAISVFSFFAVLITTWLIEKYGVRKPRNSAINIDADEYLASRRNSTELTAVLAIAVGVMAIVSMLIFLLTLLFGLLASSITSAGKVHALKIVTEIQETPWVQSSNRDVVVESSNEVKIPDKTRLVTCTTEYCVIAYKDGILTIPRDHIRSLSTRIQSMSNRALQPTM